MSEEIDAKREANKENIRIDDYNKAESDAYVHLFTRTATILGYSMMIFLVVVLYMRLISYVDFTDSVYHTGKIST